MILKLARYSTYALISMMLLALSLFARDSLSTPSVPPTDDDTVKPVHIEDPLPFAQTPILYHDARTSDALATWSKRLDVNPPDATFDEQTGYLPHLLKELSLSVESQVLVFSKTAVNTRQVSPQTPRAIYFNDEVYVAWVPGAKTLELAAVDPVKGFLFYTLPQDPQSGIKLSRDQSCLTCHINSSTLNIPGVMLRSMSVDQKGKPYEGFPRITHASPYAKRWGGWYVTGLSDGLTHLGNLIGKDEFRRHIDDHAFRGTVVDLAEFCDLTSYPSAHSDVVPMLVFNHQAHGQNLILRASYEARLNVKSNVEEELFRYLLFLDEPPLTQPLQGAREYRTWFEHQGPADDTGHSLRAFDLHTRLFRFRVSYLMYSRPFQQLPDDVKSRLYTRIKRAIAGNDEQVPAAWHTDEERARLSHLLKATVADW
ncbi:MAG: hypothetical protein O2955_10955 [Planctomycetota bacterium]|nr:hypothetical protein [Planctomycetota bacterium]MDA1213031.1 hypothetical protein [Planctomycetota bacterium]